MRKSSLRTKILLSIGLIIFVVLGTSTLIHIQDLRRDYLEAIEWRSEALAQSISSEILKRYGQYSFAGMDVSLEDILSTGINCGFFTHPYPSQEGIPAAPPPSCFPPGRGRGGFLAKAQIMPVSSIFRHYWGFHHSSV